MPEASVRRCGTGNPELRHHWRHLVADHSSSGRSDHGPPRRRLHSKSGSDPIRPSPPMIVSSVRLDRSRIVARSSSSTHES